MIQKIASALIGFCLLYLIMSALPTTTAQTAVTWKRLSSKNGDLPAPRTESTQQTGAPPQPDAAPGSEFDDQKLAPTNSRRFLAEEDSILIRIYSNFQSSVQGIKVKREYETNENNETNEMAERISFVSLFSFVSYSPLVRSSCTPK